MKDGGRERGMGKGGKKGELMVGIGDYDENLF